MSQPPFPPYNPNDQNYWNQQQPGQPQNPYQQNPNQQNTYQQNPYQQNFPPNPYQQFPFGMPRDLPNAGGILALGIISIVGAFCYALPGLGCSIPALIMGNKAIRMYEENPGMYTSSSYNNAKTGRICGIIGLSLSIIVLLLVIAYFIFIFSFISSIGAGIH